MAHILPPLCFLNYSHVLYPCFTLCLPALGSGWGLPGLLLCGLSDQTPHVSRRPADQLLQDARGGRRHRRHRAAHRPPSQYISSHCKSYQQNFTVKTLFMFLYTYLVIVSHTNRTLKTLIIAAVYVFVYKPTVKPPI